jgi:hypothetical protein
MSTASARTRFVDSSVARDTFLARPRAWNAIPPGPKTVGSIAETPIDAVYLLGNTHTTPLQRCPAYLLRRKEENRQGKCYINTSHRGPKATTKHNVNRNLQEASQRHLRLLYLLLLHTHEELFYTRWFP